MRSSQPNSSHGYLSRSSGRTGRHSAVGLRLLLVTDVELLKLVAVGDSVGVLECLLGLLLGLNFGDDVRVGDDASHDLLGLGGPDLGNCADALVDLYSVLGAECYASHSMAVIDLLPQQWASGERGVTVLPSDNAFPCGIDHREVTELEVQLASVLLGDVLRVDELLQCRLDLVRRENEDLGDCDWVEPALDPCPNCVEEHGRTNNEDAVQRLGVMRSSQCAGSLHVCLQVPELLQANTRDIYHVVAHGDGHLWHVPVLELRAEGHVEAREVLVEGEQAEHTGRGLTVGVGFAEGGLGALLLVLADGLVVEGLDFEDVEGDATSIATAGPLGVLVLLVLRLCE